MQFQKIQYGDNLPAAASFASLVPAESVAVLAFAGIKAVVAAAAAGCVADQSTHQRYEYNQFIMESISRFIERLEHIMIDKADHNRYHLSSL